MRGRTASFVPFDGASLKVLGVKAAEGTLAERQGASACVLREHANIPVQQGWPAFSWLVLVPMPIVRLLSQSDKRYRFGLAAQIGLKP